LNKNGIRFLWSRLQNVVLDFLIDFFVSFGRLSLEVGSHFVLFLDFVCPESVVKSVFVLKSQIIDLCIRMEVELLIVNNSVTLLR
jgi:hypothetical protein